MDRELICRLATVVLDYYENNQEEQTAQEFLDLEDDEMAMSPEDVARLVPKARRLLNEGFLLRAQEPFVDGVIKFYENQRNLTPAQINSLQATISSKLHLVQ